MVAILASKRKGNTYQLLLQIQALLLQHGTKLEILPLYQHDIRDCVGCEACILNGECAIKDDVSAIMDALAKADGIILASPVYLQQVSGKMKTLFDRTCSWYHRPVLTQKPVLCVATTKGSGLKATLAYMENVASQWGAIFAGSIGRSIFTQQNPVRDAEIAKLLCLLDAPCTYAPSVKELIGFEVQKSLSQHLNGLDAAYWRENGWMQRPYFYACRVNWPKRTISGFVGRSMRKGMAKGAAAQNVLDKKSGKHKPF